MNHVMLSVQGGREASCLQVSASFCRENHYFKEADTLIVQLFCESESFISFTGCAPGRDHLCRDWDTSVLGGNILSMC